MPVLRARSERHACGTSGGQGPEERQEAPEVQEKEEGGLAEGGPQDVRSVRQDDRVQDLQGGGKTEGGVWVWVWGCVTGACERGEGGRRERARESERERIFVGPEGK